MNAIISIYYSKSHVNIKLALLYVILSTNEDRLAMDGYFNRLPIKNTFRINQIHTIWKRSLRDNENFNGESHNFSEFVCSCGGDIGIMADTSLYSLSKGQCVFHAPNEFHNIWAISRAPEVIVITFSSDGLPPMTDGTFNMTTLELSELSDIYDSTMSLLDEMVSGSVDDCSQHDFALSILIKKLEILLTTVFTPSRREEKLCKGAGANMFNQIINVMRDYLYKIPSKSELAEQANISVSYMGKVISRYTGHGAMEYFTLMKMQKALYLLKEGHSVKQTAYTLGYEDPSYFSNVFKKHMGLSPTHFIKKQSPPFRVYKTIIK